MSARRFITLNSSHSGNVGLLPLTECLYNMVERNAEQDCDSTKYRSSKKAKATRKVIMIVITSTQE